MNARKGQKVVSMGSWVRLREHGADDDEVFEIAQFTSARENKLSPDNPMGKVLLGKKPGDEVAMQAPSGTIIFSILDVGRNEHVD